MQKTNKRDSVWQLLAGIFIAELGMSLIAFGAWDALKTDTRILIYVGGVLLFFSGLLAIQIAPVSHPLEAPAISTDHPYPPGSGGP
jgi:hypothetical protein